MLMLRHIEVNRLALRQCNPLDSSFKIFLANHLTRQELISDLDSSTAILAEIPLCIRHPGAGVYYIPKLLVRELHTCDVDRSEPVELLLVVARANVDHELVIEDLLLLRCSQTTVSIVCCKKN